MDLGQQSCRPLVAVVLRQLDTSSRRRLGTDADCALRGEGVVPAKRVSFEDLHGDAYILELHGYDLG